MKQTKQTTNQKTYTDSNTGNINTEVALRRKENMCKRFAKNLDRQTEKKKIESETAM